MENIDPIFITIGLLSIVGLTLTIQGFLQNRRAALVPDDSVGQIRDLIAQKKYKELLDFTEADDTFVSNSLNAALKRAPDFEAMREAMETTVGEQTAERFRKIEYLNIIGNLGPLLGLLGTVWGMIIAFSEMDAAGGNASPGQLAGGVSKALAHTFLGLGLAVPCLAAFGVLRTIIDRRTIEAGLLSEELLLSIKPADFRGGTGAPTRPVTGVPQPAPPPPRRPAPPAVSPSPADL
jgi:biopolymer transport protein ExbB